MENIDFSVPYNGDPELLPELFKLNRLWNNSIREIFLCGPKEFSGSGRITPEVNSDEFAEIVNKIHKEGIRVNLVLNSTCEGTEWYSSEFVNSTMEYLKWVHEELGVEAITIANPLYVSKVREKFPNIEICASVLGDIDCVQRAVIYRKVGADIISPDVNINRDFGLLKDIKEATGAKLKLLVNEGCLYKCPFRKFHFNVTSHASREPGRFTGKVLFADFFGFGIQVISEDHSQLLKSCWIRPEDLREYGKITSYFKIVGRAQLKSFVIRAAKAYLEEKWNGDLLDIISGCSKRFSLKAGAYLNNESLGEHNFFETVTSCNNKCDQCGYCKDLAEQLIEIGVITPEKGEDSDPNNLAERLRSMGRLP